MSLPTTSRLLALGLGLLLPALPGVASAGPTLQTTFGAVEGATDALGNDVFLGIPFAAPPVGAARWSPPADPPGWRGLRPALSFPPECVQMGTVVDPETGEETSAPVGSEDCLYLNVWRPEGADAGGDRPILFWIHGGANSIGSTSEPWYDGARLAASQDVVVVSVQYRLNAMGFFNHPGLATGEALKDSGNFALLDQLKGLQWVQANAEAIGGDAARVMVFGESAGGYNTWSLSLSPLADGLFSTAAVQSGCPSWISFEDAAAQSERMVEVLVVADGLATAETAAAYIDAQPAHWLGAYLGGKSAQEILAALNDEGLISFNFAGIEDGAVLPRDADGVFNAGAYEGRPTIVGANRDEARALFFLLYPMGPVGYNALMNGLFAENRAAVEAAYPARDYLGKDLYYKRLTDIGDFILELVCGSHAALVASDHHPVWLYRFDFDDLAPPMDVAWGAGHTAEIPFVFDTPEAGQDYGSGTEAARRVLTFEMQSAWACLAREGRPDNCVGTRSWPELSRARPERLIFDTPSTLARVPQSELEKIDFWLTYGEAGRMPGSAALMSMDPRALP